MKKQKINRIPNHETFCIAGILAAVGGFLDAYTYLLRGGVFANAQTGNVVLLAVHMAEGKPRTALFYVIPIFAFVLGVFVSEYIKQKFAGKSFAAWEHLVILLEIILLGSIGFMSLSVPDWSVNVLVSFICSLQVNSFRTVKNLAYASTMCTGNLRSGTEYFFRAIVNGSKESAGKGMHYYGIIAFFLIGAAVGTVLAKAWGVRSIWVCSITLLLVLVRLLWRK